MEGFSPNFFLLRVFLFLTWLNTWSPPEKESPLHKVPLCFVCSHRCECSLCDAFLVASSLRNKVGFHGKRYWQKAEVNSCLLTENKIMCVLFFSWFLRFVVVCDRVWCIVPEYNTFSGAIVWCRVFVTRFYYWMKFFATSSCCGIKWLLAIFVVDVSSFVSVASMQSVLCLLCFYCIVYKLIRVKIGVAALPMSYLPFWWWASLPVRYQRVNWYLQHSTGLMPNGIVAHRQLLQWRFGRVVQVLLIFTVFC